MDREGDYEEMRFGVSQQAFSGAEGKPASERVMCLSESRLEEGKCLD